MDLILKTGRQICLAIIISSVVSGYDYVTKFEHVDLSDQIISPSFSVPVEKFGLLANHSSNCSIAADSSIIVTCIDGFMSLDLFSRFLQAKDQKIERSITMSTPKGALNTRSTSVFVSFYNQSDS